MTKGTEGGYFRLFRRQFRPSSEDGGCEFWSEPRSFSKWEAWIDLIQLASWKSREISTKSGPVILRRGETFPLSTRFLSLRWGWGRQATRTFLERLDTMERVRASRTTQSGTTYLIVNYEVYQGEQPTNCAADDVSEFNQLSEANPPNSILQPTQADFLTHPVTHYQPTQTIETNDGYGDVQPQSNPPNNPPEAILKPTSGDFVTQSRRRDTEKKGKKKKEYVPLPEDGETTPALVFPVKGAKKEWVLTFSKLGEYVETYEVAEHVLLAELRKARQWLVDQPDRRKTARGMPRFLGSWLRRWNDDGRAYRASANGNGTRSGARPRYQDAEGLWRDSETHEVLYKDERGRQIVYPSKPFDFKPGDLAPAEGCYDIWGDDEMEAK